jgi:hypothetical protein
MLGVLIIWILFGVVAAVVVANKGRTRTSETIQVGYPEYLPKAFATYFPMGTRRKALLKELN